MSLNIIENNLYAPFPNDEIDRQDRKLLSAEEFFGSGPLQALRDGGLEASVSLPPQVHSSLLHIKHVFKDTRFVVAPDNRLVIIRPFSCGSFAGVCNLDHVGSYFFPLERAGVADLNNGKYVSLAYEEKAFPMIYVPGGDWVFARRTDSTIGAIFFGDPAEREFGLALPWMSYFHEEGHAKRHRLGLTSRETPSSSDFGIKAMTIRGLLDKRNFELKNALIMQSECAADDYAYILLKKYIELGLDIGDFYENFAEARHEFYMNWYTNKGHGITLNGISHLNDRYKGVVRSYYRNINRTGAYGQLLNNARKTFNELVGSAYNLPRPI